PGPARTGASVDSWGSGRSWSPPPGWPPRPGGRTRATWRRRPAPPRWPRLIFAKFSFTILPSVSPRSSIDRGEIYEYERETFRKASPRLSETVGGDHAGRDRAPPPGRQVGVQGGP